MIEIEMDKHIDPRAIKGMTTEELEDYIEESIAIGLTREMKTHLDEMSFVDMEMTEDGSFHIKAELVLCSKSDIITNIQRQSVKLAGYGLTEEQILNVLETTVEINKGF